MGYGRRAAFISLGRSQGSSPLTSHMDNEEEIKYEDLTLAQQRLADMCLKPYKLAIVYWGRRSGKSFLAKYLEQEFRKLQ